MKNVTLGVFMSRDQAESALTELGNRGYSAKDISILMKDSETARAVGDSTGTNVAEAATSGATTGGILGGIAGLLVGIGAITFPGIGGLLIGGPLVAALGLTGTAATTATGAITGAAAGGLIGALMGLGLPQETAVLYETQINEGGILLAVPNQVGGNTVEVKEILRKSGATQIDVV
jgi:hypothetical protein